jgi:hypothetical protein
MNCATGKKKGWEYKTSAPECQHGSRCLLLTAAHPSRDKGRIFCNTIDNPPFVTFKKIFLLCVGKTSRSILGCKII